MRKSAVFIVDLCWVAISPFIALLLRDDFVVHAWKLEGVVIYSSILVAASAITFAIADVNKTLWQYTSLSDVLRIIAAVTVAFLLALFGSFVVNRLEGISRSAPVIQWLIVVGGMIAIRVAVRIKAERAKRDHVAKAPIRSEPTLVIGANDLTELYLKAAAEYARSPLEIVGVLSDRHEFQGRALRQKRILGRPENLLKIMRQLETHGIILERIAVMLPFEELSPSAGEALMAVERGSNVRVDWLIESLGLTATEARLEDDALPSRSKAKIDGALHLSAALEAKPLTLEMYGYVKRIFDILAAVLLAITLAPIISVVALLIALDVGLPLVFWQRRLGRHGNPFRLFKFRTMLPAHDVNGSRIPDTERLSKLGGLVRRMRLDELPQLYNILVGEMSFVGPRPLLASDQPTVYGPRLSVRPGLTGLAQVYGGRHMPAEAKNMLDIWYIRKASLGLDLKILFRTLIVLAMGDRVDDDMMRLAKAGLVGLRGQDTAEPNYGSLVSNCSTENKQAADV